jgi:GNAT superfamily N-acetyltransferase
MGARRQGIIGRQAGMPLKTFTLAERPEREDEFERFAEAGCPSFLRQRDALGSGRLWPSLFTTFARYQILLFDGDKVVGVAHSAPIAWDGTPAGLPESIAGILESATGTAKPGRRPTALAALTAITAGHEGRGFGAELLKAMQALAREHGLGTLVASVRPSQKARYPLAPMERYVRWTRPDGAPLDPWIRAHWRLGAEIVRVVARTLMIEGTVDQWQDWTEMAFPDSGPYVVPGALQPVVIDRDREEGRYEDPNVWMVHRPPRS